VPIGFPQDCPLPPIMKEFFSYRRPLLFFLFFVSGFCGLLYQVVWTRLAFATFGVITPVLSVVISVFMLGLALGSWAAGRWVQPLTVKTRVKSAIVFYALTELLIGVGAFAVPKLFALGGNLLLVLGQTDSVHYLLLSAVMLAISILPWCVLMGATFPLMMAYVREREASSSESFSYLYLANVLGAVAGTALTAVVLIEALGFRHTLWSAASGNWLVAATAFMLARGISRTQAHPTQKTPAEVEVQTAVPVPTSGDLRPATNSDAACTRILFSTGFVAMAMEVVWIKAFTPVLKTVVYSFAFVLATYLAATATGSFLYRRHLRQQRAWSLAHLVALVSIAAFLPILMNDPHWARANDFPDLRHADLFSVLLVLLSICPFCAVLGYLTPSVVDEFAQGSPRRAGRAYAINVLGCILGPLAASYLLLPQLGNRHALLLLALPLLLLCVAWWKTLPRSPRRVVAVALAGVAACALFFSRDYEDHLLKTKPGAVIRRDYAASVLSYGRTMREKRLLVNGIGMTVLTPVTKFMAHLPMAFHTGRPQSVLIICFGMGTTYRSAMSWDVETTAVELVPGVKDAFSYYHEDAPKLLQNPKGQIVVDDGRRYLKRAGKQFDIIMLDPPPPLEAAGSSLLYSQEFYALAKEHLKPGGIIQAWIPAGDANITHAALRSLSESFPHVRCFAALFDDGVHALASMTPIESLTAAELISRMPPAAQQDLQEWAFGENVSDYLGKVLAKEWQVEWFLDPNPAVRITDDRPYNEYWLLRENSPFKQ